jgi:hypothetical protein
MGYIISLLIGAAVIGGAFLGPFDFADILKANAINIIAPAPRELKAIDTLKQQQEVLGAFIADSLIGLPKNATASQKEKIRQAQQALKDSEALLLELREQVEEDMPGLFTTIVKKLITDPNSPDPTSIPPQCKLTC